MEKVAKKKKKDEKNENLEKGEVQEARAIARYVRTSPRKLRLVMDEIRGRKVEEAFKILKFTPKRAAKTLEKVLKSAVANAENNKQLDSGNLIVYKAYVDVGPTMKRWIPRAMGRASQIHKRTSHITFIVREGVS